MKGLKILAVLGMVISSVGIYAHDIARRDVPAIIWNKFITAYPKANHVEWEMKGMSYKAEFEIGLWGTEHEIWYDQTGKMLKHKEEWSVEQLPVVVKKSLENAFGVFRLKDIDKITTSDGVIFSIEVKSQGQEWDVLINEKGNIIQKILD